jgi:hypothetical protein
MHLLTLRDRPRGGDAGSNTAQRWRTPPGRYAEAVRLAGGAYAFIIGTGRPGGVRQRKLDPVPIATHTGFGPLCVARPDRGRCGRSAYAIPAEESSLP